VGDLIDHFAKGGTFVIGYGFDEFILQGPLLGW
jgi:hypothetical protein